MEPYFQNVQAHYDLSDAFFALFLDPSMMYSCAYFERDDMTLQQAQNAKIDLSLDKLDLQPGMTLLDIGCGWGATLLRASQRFGARDLRGIGLTLSRNQQSTATARAVAHASNATTPAPDASPRLEYRLLGWEQFQEPVDRIVSIGAFEHFRAARFGEFFARCRDLLQSPKSAPGRMLLHTIVFGSADTLAPGETLATHEHILFAKFIQKKIFPGGQLTTAAVVEQHAKQAGFRVERVHSLRPHYARTLDCWAHNLSAHRDQAIALTSLDIYEMYMRYLTGCANYFRSGHLDVCQFTLVMPHSTLVPPHRLDG